MVDAGVAGGDYSAEGGAGVTAVGTGGEGVVDQAVVNVVDRVERFESELEQGAHGLGLFVDAFGSEAVFVVMGFLHPIAMLIVLSLVRQRPSENQIRCSEDRLPGRLAYNGRRAERQSS